MRLEKASTTGHERCAQFVAHNLHLGNTHDIALAAWLMLALASSFLALTTRLNEITHDSFHEMSLFREALIAGSLPQNDLFAYTPTVAPSVHHEWGTGAILYFATVGSGLGWIGLIALKLLLMVSLWCLLYRVARLRGAHPILFTCLSLLVFPVLWVGFSTVRAQLFTLVFLASQLYMQELDWRGRRAWILVWLVMLVAWLNMHAGFVVGLGLIAFHTLERMVAAWMQKGRLSAVLHDTWHLILAAPVAFAALWVNPYGSRYIPYLVHAIGMSRPFIREWQPIWYTYAPVITIVLLAASIGMFVYCQRHTRLRRLRGTAFLALCIYMAVKHIRHGSLFAIVWIAYVPAWFSRTAVGKSYIHWIEAHRTQAIRLCQIVVVTTLAFAVGNQFWHPTLSSTPKHSSVCYPVGAVEYLRSQGFKGNLQTPFHAGSYVSWELYPAVHVSLDGRYEVAYQEHVMGEHHRFVKGEADWWEILDKYSTDAVLVQKGTPVAKLLEPFRTTSTVAQPPIQSSWYFAYEDDSYFILAKPATRLPPMSRIGEAIADGAGEALSPRHTHWNRKQTRPFYSVNMCSKRLRL